MLRDRDWRSAGLCELSGASSALVRVSVLSSLCVRLCSYSASDLPQPLSSLNLPALMKQAENILQLKQDKRSATPPMLDAEHCQILMRIERGCRADSVSLSVCVQFCFWFS